MRHHLMVPEDFHDWDASAASAVATTAAGVRTVLAGAKDGNLHAFEDVASASGDGSGDATAELSRDAAPDGGEPTPLVPFNKRFTRSVTTRVNTDAPRTPKDTYFCPGALGGVQWNGPAYAPDTNIAYVGAVDWCATVTVQSGSQARSVSLGQLWSGNAPQGETDIFGAQDFKAMARGWLNAIHADTGEVMWVWNAPTPLLPGVIPTAGGIVMAGDLDGVLHVFDRVNGAQLASHALGGPISGGVITYNDDGTEAGPQLVAVASAMNAPVWDWKDGPAKITVLGLEE